MRFEPRIFNDDDEPRDLPGDDAVRREPSEDAAPAADDTFELPAELAALSEQLGDDADHLAACYPPRRTTETSQPAADARLSRHGRILRWGGATAAVVIGIVSWQLVARQWGDVDPPTRDIAAMNSTPIALDVRPSTTVESKPTRGARGMPTAVFRNLTGAEQEAALDLMQNDPQGQGELSI